ncbi:MAG: glutamine--fructose-6-phosphate transaminase (isomerizing) [Nitrososphaerales archaeon]
MCSIIGYEGRGEAAPLLVKGLQRMEYRGYDSAGVAILSQREISVRKGVGKVSEVNALVHMDELRGEVGVGHTRWATHGGVTEANAHPHLSNSGQIALVHNGIVTNYMELKEELRSKGFSFNSQTDTEVIVNLLQLNFEETRDVKTAMMRTVARLKGNYSFAAVFPDGTLAAARFHEPLIVGISRDGYLVASDILGFVEQTDKVIYLDNREIVAMKDGGQVICDFDGKPVRHELIRVSNEIADADKGDYVHYTLKEIFEQPVSILRTAEKIAPEVARAAEMIKHAKNLYITGSGSSFHAALVGKYLFSKFGGLNIEAIMSSEAEFSPHHLDSESVMIAISQSGETADVLEAANWAKEKGAKVISIVNKTSSSLAQMSSLTIGLDCGPEIGVAATKSFTSQLVVLYTIAGLLSGGSLKPRFDDLSRQMTEVLENQTKIKALAEKLTGVSDIYILGMGANYSIASEAALKIKELAYVHAEALPGGELKHGPLALLDSNSYVVFLNPSDSTHSNVLTSAHEVKARGAKIIGISDRPSEVYDYWINIPSTEAEMFPLVEIVPMQLLAYYLAIHRNANPDYPRNLAKSVTVK